MAAGGNIGKPILNAEQLVSDFIDRAGAATNAREASDWALAAKNLAATLHSLIGAQQTARRAG